MTFRAIQFLSWHPDAPLLLVRAMFLATFCLLVAIFGSVTLWVKVGNPQHRFVAYGFGTVFLVLSIYLYSWGYTLGSKLSTNYDYLQRRAVDAGVEFGDLPKD